MDIEVNTGSKWLAGRALREVEECLNQGKLEEDKYEGPAWHGAEGGL